MNGRGWLIVIGGSILAIAGLVGGAYQHGRHVARTELEASARQDSLDHNAEQLRMSAQVLAANRRASSAELARDSIALARYVVARGKVRIVSDSQVAIVAPSAAGDGRDSVGLAVEVSNPTIDVPKEVVALITAAEAALRQDSVTMMAQAAELQTLYRRDTLHVERERLYERQLAESKPQRCGRRCGFVAGVAVTAAATHPAETVQLVVRAVTWIVRRF